MIDLNEPVIWTSRGNVNERDVAKFDEWQFPGDGVVVHIVGCKDKATGEIIKRGVYVFHPGLGADGVAGSIR